MILLSPGHLECLFPRLAPSAAAIFAAAINDAAQRRDIVTAMRMAHFLAQIGWESSSLTIFTENLNYSAAGLAATFPAYFSTPDILARYARHPEAIANRAYANRMGNGSEASGDGWRYRGAGAIQLTGKDNHAAFAKASSIPLDDIGAYLVTPRGAIHSAAWFWNSRNINAAADTGSVARVTRLINGGTNGLAGRQALTDRARRLLGA